LSSDEDANKTMKRLKRADVMLPTQRCTFFRAFLRTFLPPQFSFFTLLTTDQRGEGTCSIVRVGVFVTEKEPMRIGIRRGKEKSLLRINRVESAMGFE
jgi:hypothetical protein